MNGSLRREIILHIFDLFGINILEREVAGTVVFSDDTIIDKTLSFEENGNSYEGTVWAAQMELAPGHIRCIVSDTSIGDAVEWTSSQLSVQTNEFVLAFQMEGSAIYALRLSANPNDLGIFNHQVSDGVWIPASTYLQAMVLAGFEQMTSLPFVWVRCEAYTEIYNGLINFLQNGE